MAKCERCGWLGDVDLHRAMHEKVCGKTCPCAKAAAAPDALTGERRGCSWCNDTGEVGPPDDRFECPCPAAWHKSAKAKAHRLAQELRAALARVEKAERNAEAHAVGREVLRNTVQTLAQERADALARAEESGRAFDDAARVLKQTEERLSAITNADARAGLIRAVMFMLKDEQGGGVVDRVRKIKSDRDAFRASLAAAQEREGKMREALEKVRGWHLGDAKSGPPERRDSELRAEWIDAALAGKPTHFFRPAPAVPEAAPRLRSFGIECASCEQEMDADDVAYCESCLFAETESLGKLLEAVDGDLGNRFANDDVSSAELVELALKKLAAPRPGEVERIKAWDAHQKWEAAHDCMNRTCKCVNPYADAALAPAEVPRG